MRYPLPLPSRNPDRLCLECYRPRSRAPRRRACNRAKRRRSNYACKAYEETIRSAPVLAHSIPEDNASPGLLAHIAAAKYQDASPLARQEKILQRAGVDIPRATLAGWMIKLGIFLAPRIAQLHAWLAKSLPEVPPSTLTGKALAYLHSQWARLIGYPDDGRLTIDDKSLRAGQRHLDTAYCVLFARSVI